LRPKNLQHPGLHGGDHRERDNTCPEALNSKHAETAHSGHPTGEWVKPPTPRPLCRTTTAARIVGAPRAGVDDVHPCRGGVADREGFVDPRGGRDNMAAASSR
jgi:hypothetical protein